MNASSPSSPRSPRRLPRERDDERDICPLYAVRLQQRLAFLDDLDSIRCRQSDPERGFEAGEQYPLRTSSDVRVRRYEKASTTRSGEIAVRRYEEEAKVLVVDIAGQRFDESADDVAYIVDHFDLPVPATSAHDPRRRSSR